MIVNRFDKENTILNRYMAELRDENIQRDPVRFRLNLERIGALLAYEISRTLDYQYENVITPLGEAPISLPYNKLVIASILRAGIPMHNGMLEIFDNAESAFVSAYRKYSKDGTMKIEAAHITTPDLDGKTLIIVDPMLATGASIELSYRHLCEKGGTPERTHFVAAVSSTDGIEYLRRHLALNNITVWTAAIDNELTVRSYIVPGIGDPGDLAYGEKV